MRIYSWFIQCFYIKFLYGFLGNKAWSVGYLNYVLQYCFNDVGSLEKINEEKIIEG